MTEHDKADQARKGLLDSMKGKAKEVAGAVLRNDSLTAEGQLEQTQAQERKEANSVEAVADAEAAQARAEAAEASLDGAADRVAVSAKTAAVEDSVEAQQVAQKRAAEQAAQRDAIAERARAELDAQREEQRAKAQERVDTRAAAGVVVDAVDEHQAEMDDAESALTEAARMRQRADRLINQADLP